MSKNSEENQPHMNVNRLVVIQVYDEFLHVEHIHNELLHSTCSF